MVAAIGADDGSWRLSFHGSNVLNERFVVRTIVQSSGSYYTNVVPYEARARFGGSLEFKF